VCAPFALCSIVLNPFLDVPLAQDLRRSHALKRPIRAKSAQDRCLSICRVIDPTAEAVSSEIWIRNRISPVLRPVLLTSINFLSFLQIFVDFDFAEIRHQEQRPSRRKADSVVFAR
jgi:hypothetical protein